MADKVFKNKILIAGPLTPPPLNGPAIKKNCFAALH